MSADETTLTVNYSLNATATAVSVVILDGETVVKTVDCADKGLTQGAYEVEIPTTDLPKTKSLTWKVEVKGESVAAPTIQSDLTLSYCLPRGIGIDRSPESPYFGRIYTTEATAGGDAYHSKEGKGLYAFEPSLTPIKNSKGGLVFTGGITYGTDDISRVVVAEDGRVFVSRFTPTDVSPVLEVNPADLNENFKDVFTTIKGKTIGIDVKGAGENLQLVMLSTAERTITEYDLGTATTWTESTPSRTYTKKDLTTEKALSLVTDNAYISYDNIDGVWLTQHRATATTTEPTIAHVIETGVDYNNFNAGLTHEGTSNGGIAISPDGKLLAVVGAGTKKLTIFDVSRDNGEIKLTSKYTISTAGNNHTALTWDYAGNLYVANRSAETITFYAMPYSGQVSTPCASKYAFQLQEEVVGTFYTVTANANDPAMGEITGNDGQYTAGATATLTAVPAAGYKFVNWTVGEETKTENPLTLTVNSDLTVTANFAALPQYTITATANDAAMGAVTGAGTYYEGEEVTLKAIANTGHEFVDWNNGATEATLTFVAARDSVVVANFKKRSYTLTVFVNDENKGSVDVATGAYEYGEEVTLTATPAEGYELLAWSSKETTAQITVTMDNHKAVSAYFVKSYTQEPTFKIEKLWENTQVPSSTGNGYQAVGWDGKIYMQNSGASKIMSYTNGTDAATEYATSGAGYQIAIDEAGNLIVYNGYFATTTHNNVLIYAKGSTTGKQVTFTLPQDARCDFFTASGDIYSEEGGYIYFYCNGTTVVNRLKITNGAATDADVTTDVICANLPGAGTQSNVVIDIYGNIHVESKNKTAGVYNITTLAVTNDTYLGAASKATPTSTIGGCTFELGGKELWAYLVGTTNYSSEWQLYNATTGVSIADELYLTDNKLAAGATANWLNVQVVDEKTAYIYQFCPKVAVAVWKVTCDTGEEPGTGTAVDNTNVAPQVQKIVRDGQVLIIRDGKTFNMMGQEVK